MSPQGKREIKYFGRSAAAYAELHTGILFAAQQFEHLLVGHSGSGHYRVIDSHNAVAGQQTDLLGWAARQHLYHGDSIVDYRKRHPYSTERPLEFGIDIGQFRCRYIHRVGVQLGKQIGYCQLYKTVDIDPVDHTLRR